MTEQEMTQYRADFDRKMAEATKKRCQKAGCTGALCPMAWERSAEMWERLMSWERFSERWERRMMAVDNG